MYQIINRKLKKVFASFLMFTMVVTMFFGIPKEAKAAPLTIVLNYNQTILTEGTSWTVPDDWTNGNNTIEVIGGGAAGLSDLTGAAGSGGGGGGGYSKITNLSLTPGATVVYQIGVGGKHGAVNGGASFFNRTAGVAGTCADTVSVCANGGTGATNATGGAGGSTTGADGSTLWAGGAGGTGHTTGDSGGGGGGAGGPSKAGQVGGAGYTVTTAGGGGGGGGNGGTNSAVGLPGSTIGGWGGNGDLGTGSGLGGNAASGGNATTSGAGGGGGDAALHGGNGAAGTNLGGGVGPGGGGGGGGDTSTALGVGGDGGLYGAGGGGGRYGGRGAPGVIVITYNGNTPTRTGWTVPDDWNDTNNTIEVIGAGGAAFSGAQGTGGKGGGGGAYSKITNLDLTPGGTVTYQIGRGGQKTVVGVGVGVNGGDTFFNRTAGTAGTCADTTSVCAKGGGGGTTGTTGGGAGGLATGGTGTTKWDGGIGGDGNGTGDSGGGGGGAGGATQNGKNGGAGSTSASQGGGGGGGAGDDSGTNSTVGEAGVTAATTGGDGGLGPLGTGNGLGGTGAGPAGTSALGGGGAGGWQGNNGGAGGSGSATTYGGGGGGGVGDNNISVALASHGGDGGLYGAGGGGGLRPGFGASGIIIITYEPVVLPTVTTEAESNVADTTVTLNGTITATGGGAGATVRGFAYGTSATLQTTIATTTDTVGQPFGTGAFTGAVTGLTCNTTYYSRPYATNSLGTGFGTIDTFTTAACGGGNFMVAGNAYDDEATGDLAICDGTTSNIAVSVNGGAAVTGTCANSGNAFSIDTGGVAPAAGTLIHIWVDGVAGCNGNNANSCATTVIRYSGSGNIANAIVRKNRLIIRDDDGTGVSNANIGLRDNTNDPDIVYEVDVSNNIVVEDNIKVIVPTGDTYTPAGTVTTSPSASYGTVDGDIDVIGTLTLAGNALSVGGDFVNTGTVTYSAGHTVTFTATAVGHTINDGANNFDTIVFNGAGGGWGFASALTTVGNLTITNGTLTSSSSALTIAGNFSIAGTYSGSGTATTTINGDFTGAGTVNLSAGGVEQRVGATKSFGTSGGANAWTFNNLTFSNSHASSPFTITTGGGSGIVNILGNLYIGKTGDAAGAVTTFNAGTRVWNLSNTATPLRILASPAGVLAGATSTFDFTGNGATVTASAGYNNLGLKPNGASQQVLGAGTFTIGGTLTVGNGANAGATAATNNPVINVTGNTTIDTGAIYTTGNGAVTLTGDLAVNGTLSGLGTGAITVNGGDVTGNGTINLTGNTFLVDGAGNFGGNTAWSFTNLTFGNGTGVTSTTGTGTGSITASSTMTVAANQTLLAGSRTWNLTGTGGGGAAPTFIQEAEVSDWNVISSPKTTASFNVVSGDILVAYSMVEDNQALTVSDNTGTTANWIAQRTVNTAGFSGLVLYTKVVTVTESMTTSFNCGTCVANGRKHGGNVMTFRGGSAVGASSVTNVSGGAPTLNITTTQANSVVAVANADWAPVDGAARTWRTNAGAFSETTYAFHSPNYTIYGGYHADAGAVGTYAVGLSAPAGQTYSIAAVEIKGASGSGPLVVYGTFTGQTGYVNFAGNTNVTIPVASTTYNNLILSPTITADRTYTFAGATTTTGGFRINPSAAGAFGLKVNLGGALTITGTTTIERTGSATSSLDTVSNYAFNTGTTTINMGGNLKGNSSTITNTGSWTNNATTTGFTAGSSTVVFSTVSPITIMGTTTFNNLTVSGIGAPKTIQFQSHVGGYPIFTFTGNFTITGTAGNLISLLSTTGGTQWKAHFNSLQTGVTYASITDSGCDTGTSNVNLDPTSTLNGVNNSACWNPPANDTTLGDGTDPGNFTVAPGSSVIDLDAFTLIIATGSDTVTALTVKLLPANAFDNIAKVEITDNSNVDACTDIDNPVSLTLNFTGCSLAVSSTPATYKIRVTPKTHANMPAVASGLSHALVGTTTAITATNSTAGVDTDSATITIDNLSPGVATAMSGTAGNAKVTLAWTAPADADVATSTILRWAGGAPGSDVPVEGNTSYVAGDTIGSATVACVIGNTSSQSKSGIVDGSGGTVGCTTAALDNDSTQYSYKIFELDTRGNYNAGTTITGSPFTPTAVSQPQTIGSQLSGTWKDGTGSAFQSHLIYAENQGKWWYFSLTSGGDTYQNHVVKVYYSSSSDLSSATWTAASDKVFTTDSFNGAKLGGGRSLGVLYLNNASTDIIHLSIGIGYDGQYSDTGHIRGTIGATSITWDSWLKVVTNGASEWQGPPSTCVANCEAENTPWGNFIGASSGKYIHSFSTVQDGQVDANASRSTTADTTTTWTNDWEINPNCGPGQPTTCLNKGGGTANQGTAFTFDATMPNESKIVGFAPLANNVMLAVYSDGGSAFGGATSQPNLANIRYQRSGANSATMWPEVENTFGGDGNVFAADATINQNDWTFVAPDTSTIYVFRKNGNAINGNVYSVGGNSFSAMASQPPAFGNGQTMVASTSGPFGVTDGVDVWLFVVNNDTANTILNTKYSSGSWTAWATTTGTGTGTHSRRFISGYTKPSAGQIGLIWTEGSSPYETYVHFHPVTGAPTISSAGHQVFESGQTANNSISTITITDNAYPGITAANDLRIAIATSSVQMLWNTSDTTAIIGGTASGKVSTTVSYEGGGSVLVIPVNTNFSSSDILTIAGLSFTDFGNANPATPGLKVYNGGAGDNVADDTDDKNITIKGAFSITAHANGQEFNKFDVPVNFITDAELFAFRLNPAGESLAVSNFVLGLNGIKGIYPSNVTNAKLYVDYSADGAVDASDLQVGGAGNVSIFPTGLGNIIFSSAFTASTTRNYILKADVSGVDPGDSLNIVLNPLGITSTGVVTSQTTNARGFVGLANHIRIPIGDIVGGSAPAGSTVTQNGSSQGGQVLGDEPGFFYPTLTGSPNNQWTTASNAFDHIDGTYAVEAVAGEAQDFSFFSLPIPTNNIIDGIEVKIEASGSSAAGTIDATLSWNGGTNVSVVKSTATLGTLDTIYTLGAPNNKWGRSWTTSELSNANFRVRLTGQPSGNSVKVDAIQVKIYHHAPPAGGGGGGGGDLIVAPSKNYLANVFTIFNYLSKVFGKLAVNNK